MKRTPKLLSKQIAIGHQLFMKDIRKQAAKVYCYWVLSKLKLESKDGTNNSF